MDLYAYCGFPRSIQGLNTLIAVLDERKQKGIQDKIGKAATPVTSNEPTYERGKKILGTLTEQTQTGPPRGYSAFSPEIDVFLKEHLFADIFERDVLSYVDRELTTISVLISIGGVEPMMQSHMGIGLRTGLTESQLRQTLALIETNVGKAEAEVGWCITIRRAVPSLVFTNAWGTPSGASNESPAFRRRVSSLTWNMNSPSMTKNYSSQSMCVCRNGPTFSCRSVSKMTQRSLVSCPIPLP